MRYAADRQADPAYRWSQGTARAKDNKTHISKGLSKDLCAGSAIYPFFPVQSPAGTTSICMYFISSNDLTLSKKCSSGVTYMVD